MFWWNIFTSMPDAYTPFMKMYDLIIFVFSTCLLVGQPQQQQHKDLIILAFTTCPLVDKLEKVHICDALASTIGGGVQENTFLSKTHQKLSFYQKYIKKLSFYLKYIKSSKSIINKCQDLLGITKRGRGPLKATEGLCAMMAPS